MSGSGVLATKNVGYRNAQQAKCKPCRGQGDRSRHDPTALRYREANAQPAREKPTSDCEPKCRTQRFHGCLLPV